MGDPQQPADDPLQSGWQLLERGDWQAAADRARLVLGHHPDCSEAWNQLGKALQEAGDLGEAVEAYLQAAERDPQDVRCRVELGYLFRNISMPEEAIHWHAEALALKPDELILRLNHLFVLPIVARSSEQIAQLRRRCEEGLAELDAVAGTLRFGDYLMSHHPYYLIYHNRDDRALLETYGRLLSRPVQAVPQPALPAPLPRSRKRIGFASAFFHSHSNSRAFEGLIRYLDRARFEVVVIHLSAGPIDDVRRRIDACADQSVTISPPLESAQRQLLTLNLDLLHYTDIGMHPLATLLACRRLAPIQMTGWGVPQTSGLASLDHYVSADLVEAEGSDRQYTEQLLKLPGLPCCYLSANLETADLGRDYFLLPPDAPLFGCLQAFWKLHPDFDDLLERIARRVPEAWFVFVEADITSYTQIFLERLAGSAPTASNRVILLSRLTRPEFSSLAGCLDVLLDPPYFGSGVTLYETLHSGTPILSLEGHFLRSRLVAGAYRLIGLPHPPLARDAQEYVELAVRLIGDRAGLERLRREIRDRAERHLYDRLEGVNAFADVASELIERRWRQGGA